MKRPSLHTDYVPASLERLEESRVLIEARHYSGAIYFAGLAAESLIKGFLEAKGEEIKGHNLATLARDANLSRRLKQNVRLRFDAAVQEAAQIWRNLYRYCSEADLDRMGNQNNVRFELDGKLVRYAELPQDTRLRYWAERMYNLAALIVGEGRLLWQSKKI